MARRNGWLWSTPGERQMVRLIRQLSDKDQERLLLIVRALCSASLIVRALWAASLLGR